MSQRLAWAGPSSAGANAHDLDFVTQTRSQTLDPKIGRYGNEFPIVSSLTHDSNLVEFHPRPRAPRDRYPGRTRFRHNHIGRSSGF